MYYLCLFDFVQSFVCSSIYDVRRKSVTLTAFHNYENTTNYWENECSKITSSPLCFSDGSQSLNPCSVGCEAKFDELPCEHPYASFLSTTPQDRHLQCLFNCGFFMGPDRCRSMCTTPTTTTEWTSPSSTDSSTLTNYFQSSPANGRTIMDVYNNSGMAVVFAIAVAVVLAIFVVCSIAVCCVKKCHRRRLSNHSAVHIERAGNYSIHLEHLVNHNGQC